MLVKTIHKYAPSREDVIRIVMLDEPAARLPNEGSFEWKFRDTTLIMDLLTLEKEIEKFAPGKSTRILDRIHNFRRIFLNLTTGEITT